MATIKTQKQYSLVAANIYVNSATGSDSNTGLAVGQPLQTLAAAIALVRNSIRNDAQPGAAGPECKLALT